MCVPNIPATPHTHTTTHHPQPPPLPPPPCPQEPGGPGTLLAPLRLEAGGLVAVWLVAWPNAGRREARVGAVGGDCDLVFAPQVRWASWELSYSYK